MANLTLLHKKVQGVVMSNVHHIDERNNKAVEDARLDCASEWLAKLDRGLTKPEKDALQLWLAQSYKNVEVLLEVAHLWDKMGELSRLSDLFPQSQSRQKRLPVWLGATAASVLLAVALSFFQEAFNFSFFYPVNRSAVVAKQLNFQTGVGESKDIILPDKSEITLNTNSFVQIRYTRDSRVINLLRGEIHINVAHDKARPLSVIAGDKVIQAVGTAFNVEVGEKQIELIVTDGKVLVAEQSSSQPSSLQKNGTNKLGKFLSNNSTAVSKGEKLDLSFKGKIAKHVEKVDPIDVAASLSWRKGSLIFRGESLADAMAEISRYTNINFELSDDERLTRVQVAGMFKTGDVKGLLEVLNNNFNISYERISPDKIRLNYADPSASI
jgi:transmembrane sensor